MKKLNKIFSDKRTGVLKPKKNLGPRTEYQRDFDRLIFSSAFRRLQNKTQVFPLPGSVFVHNRLTHSLEVASVGRSLGHLIGHYIAETFEKDLDVISLDFYKNDLSNVISSACLCHDIGNPAFGHSGEDAIANYFNQNETELKQHFSNKEWSDFINFEGNANAIRVLTQQQNGKSEGGIKLTYATLCSIAKYPCESIAIDKDFTHRKKFGFFQSEKKTFIDIAESTGMIKDDSNPLIYKRHPFVWITEVADDICYNIIDLEDAHRLGIIEHSQCESFLMKLISCIGEDDNNRFEEKYSKISDKNEKIAYLRARSINALAIKSAEIYKENLEDIVNGNFNEPLFDIIKKDCGALEEITNFSVEFIYNHRNVVEIENAGYNVMYELLNHFIPPIIKSKENRIQQEKKALKLLPPTFNYDKEKRYIRTMGVLDYISGMTDNYATELYKRIKGIEIGMKI